jgi:CRISPR-associated protein Cas1
MSRTVVISESGTRLTVQNGLLCVTRNDEPVRDLKPHEVDQLVLMGRIELTSAAIALLLRRDIDCVFLTTHGHFRGRLVGDTSRNVPLRVAQYRRLLDADKALPIATAIVAGKIQNQRHLLLRVQRELADPGLAEVVAKLRIRRSSLASQKSVDVVMGVEGEASALYFGHFGKAIRNPLFAFRERNRRPPKDPVNACLSFGYALLATVIEGAVLQAGMDPLLGALHQPAYGRPSLVLDLMEEFRPILVDSLVLRLLNRRQLTPADFGPPEQEPEDLAMGSPSSSLDPGPRTPDPGPRFRSRPPERHRTEGVPVGLLREVAGDCIPPGIGLDVELPADRDAPGVPVCPGAQGGGQRV